MSAYSQETTSVEAGVNWKSLYYVGGMAPLVTLVFYLSELLFISWDKYPTSMEAWFALFQRSKLLGLFYLNALDIISVALLGVMFLALYMSLRKTHAALMIIATFFGLLGVGIFVGLRAAMLSVLQLSDRYAAALTKAERLRLLAAGETLGALGTPTLQTAGFLFIAIAVLIISVVMLQGLHFNKITAWLGIGASLLTVADDISLIVAPSLATPLMIASGLFWMLWWVMIGLGLFRLAQSKM
jgi:hypothetical protein